MRTAVPAFVVLAGLAAAPLAAIAQPEPAPAPEPAEPAPAPATPAATEPAAAPGQADDAEAPPAPVVAYAAAPAPAESAPIVNYVEETGPDRSGFTLELQIGLGFTHISADGFESETESGLAGINVGLGGWLTKRTALTFRIAGTQFSKNDVGFVAGWVGPSLQHMVTDSAFIGGGVGWGFLSTDQENVDPETGFGLNLRAGINFSQSRQHAFGASLEVTPGFYDDGSVTGFGFLVGWQYL